jgi:ribonuclease P protein component
VDSDSKRISGAPDQRFPQREVLKKKGSFQRLLHKGERWTGFYMTVYYFQAKDRQIGFGVSRRLGKAVQRNRIKRWLREIYRKHRFLIGPFHMAVFPKASVNTAGYWDLHDEFERFINEAGIGL